jgi:pimeloyl-ACP methyl ester carboxylesterase
MVGQADELVATPHHRPTGPLVEADRRVARVGPHAGRAGRPQPAFCFVEEPAADARPLVARIDGHASQLPPAVVVRDEGGDTGERPVTGTGHECAQVERAGESVDLETVVGFAVAEHEGTQLERAWSVDWMHRYRAGVAGPPPILLAHGFASSFHDNWRRTGFADLLEDAGRTVIPFDFLGHGTAPKPHDPAAYADLPGNLAAALPIDGSVVDAVGFSMGGSTLLHLAGRMPERFRRIVVAGVGENLFALPDNERMTEAIERGSAPAEDGRAKLFVQFSKRAGNDPAALAALLRRPNQAPHDPDALARVTCPTLVIIGDQDHAGSAKPLVDALPDASLVVLRNTEHFGTPRSMGFIDAALDFLLAP